ncbi:MAG: IclR family transcriptional regulator [Anaeroplasmataceae bacterium]|nr:IclR family transcriptional regulator [Anaeroplasmataceae bacterium]
MNKMIKRSVEILEYAASHQDGFRISDIMHDLSIPKSSAFDIIYTLVECEMLEVKNEKLKTFALGPKTYDIGYQYIKDNNIIDIAAPILKKLGDSLSKTVFMGKYDNDEVLYVFKYQPPTAILNHCSVNTRAELFCTALGKSMLAYREEEFDFTKIEFKKYTEKTILNVDDLKKNLEKVRKNGYAVDDREIKDYMICVSAPIFDANGITNYAISTSSLYENVDIENTAKKIIEAANTITRKSKYLIK